MKHISRLLALLITLTLLLSACGAEDKQVASFDDDPASEVETASKSESETEGEPTSESESEVITAESETETEAFEVAPEGDLETFFSVEEYDYTAETDADIIAFFGGDIGAALTKLAPSLKSVAYAAYSYPEDMVDTPEENMLWSAIYAMIDTYHQYPANYTTDSEGRVVITGAATLKAMVSDMFTADVGEIATPHADFLDSMIYYDSDADSYTFEPTGGEGLNVRLCALEFSPDGQMTVTIQLYNPIFDFTSRVSMTVTADSESIYGYTVSTATSWTEDNGLDEEDQ